MLPVKLIFSDKTFHAIKLSSQSFNSQSPILEFLKATDIVLTRNKLMEKIVYN